MQITTFENLKVWQKGRELVKDIYLTTRNFPTEEQFGLTNQMRRASISICANIAEGRKKKTKDFARYIDIAQGSLEELKSHLIISNDLEFLNRDHYMKIATKTDELGRMLNALKLS